MTPAQVRVIARWSAQGADFLPLSVHVEPPAYAYGWLDGDVLVTQGDAYLHVAKAGAVKDAIPDHRDCGVAGGGGHSAAGTGELAFVTDGARVRVRIDGRFAAELAAFGAGDDEHELGERLLRAVQEAGGHLWFPATVVEPPKPERPADRSSLVAVKIPELDHGDSLFMIRPSDIEPLESTGDR